MATEATRAKELAGLIERVEAATGGHGEAATDLRREIEYRIVSLLISPQDKERLDFLDRLNSRLNAHYGTNYHWRLITNHNVNRLMIGHMAVDLHDSEANGLPSCRDAIDARMADFKPGALAEQPQ